MNFKVSWYLTRLLKIQRIVKCPPDKCKFKISTRNTRKMFKICSKLRIKTPDRHQWRRSVVVIFNHEHISNDFEQEIVCWAVLFNVIRVLIFCLLQAANPSGASHLKMILNLTYLTRVRIFREKNRYCLGFFT